MYKKARKWQNNAEWLTRELGHSWSRSAPISWWVALAAMLPSDVPEVKEYQVRMLGWRGMREGVKVSPNLDHLLLKEDTMKLYLSVTQRPHFWHKISGGHFQMESSSAITDTGIQQLCVGGRRRVSRFIRIMVSVSSWMYCQLVMLRRLHVDMKFMIWCDWGILTVVACIETWGILWLSRFTMDLRQSLALKNNIHYYYLEVEH